MRDGEEGAGDFWGVGEREVAAMRIRRQKSSGEGGGGRTWSRRSRRAVREGRGVNNREWSQDKGCYFSDQRRKCVLDQFLEGREYDG